LDGMEAFAREETGHYDQAEALGRRGVERDPTDLWAIHAVAHVLEMQQRRAEGVDWLDQNRPVLTGGGFAGHLWWHQAIQLWALGRCDEALALFDDAVYPGDSSEGLDLTNATSLLARLEASDVEVGDRWSRLSEGATARLGRHSHPFNDSHHILALTRAGQDAQARELLAGMRAWSAGDHDAAEVLRHVGVAAGEGMLAYGSGRWSDAADHLASVADEWWRLGGSKAQRFFYATVLGDARRRAAA
ncbi:MAG: tetratricopeptide repeat protein, partial [Actinomycetota bacterium]